MRNDIFKHRLLKLLSEKYLIGNLQDLGETYDYIEKKLGVNKKKLIRDIAELFASEEIALYNNNPNLDLGLVLTTKGLASFSYGKYKKRNYDSIISVIKDLVQIIIPVGSLIIAYLSISNKIYNNKIEDKKAIEVLNKKIELLEKDILKDKEVVKIKVSNK